MFLLIQQKEIDVFDTIMDKVEESLKSLKSQGLIDEFPFVFEYFVVILWEFKNMDRQAKEKLHSLSNLLLKRKEEIDAQGNEPEIECPVKRNVDNLFGLMGSNIKEKLKLIYFELNRLYTKNKDFKWGYKVLKKWISILSVQNSENGNISVKPSDVDWLLRIAKYCHFIGRNKESRKYYDTFQALTSQQANT